MASASRRIPDGPVEKCAADNDLLSSLGAQIARYGNIFKARIYRTDAYLLSGPAYVEHVLLKNWQNYPKGRAIKRIALLLGNGLNVTRDLSFLTLDIVLPSIFGDDFEAVSLRFRIVSDDAARNLEFAVTFTSPAKSIIDIAGQRRRTSCTAQPDLLGWLMQARDRESGEGMTDSQDFHMQPELIHRSE